jgi:manganese efflux pump family protein
MHLPCCPAEPGSREPPAKIPRKNLQSILPGDTITIFKPQYQENRLGTADILLIALGLAMDAAAVCLAASAAGYAGNARAVFRLSFHFGLFQGLFPVLGWFLGMGLLVFVQGIGHWVAFFLLLFVGGRMVKSGMDPSGESHVQDPSRGMTMVLLSVAVSIDALAVGLSFAMLKVDVWYPAIVIGVVTSGLSLAAIRIGRHLGTLLGRRMEIVGGLVLIGIGTRILLVRLLA